MAAIKSLVVVHRLREVSCLYGFTRFEAAPTSTDGDIEDIQLAVHGAPVAADADWLPAVEQFGEGLFLHFDPEAIRAWLSRGAVIRRCEKLRDGHAQWRKAYERPIEFPGAAYLMLHSLSHALMTEIALDCGYPASALKERIYALADSPLGDAPGRCGILIYIASPGAQGTLGGLVAAAPRLAQILRGALVRCEVCSSDPVCADHVPDAQSGDRATHGAACHGCLLIAETSCEMRNLFLDRSLLVDTMALEGAAFFDVVR